jgi:hypothetical protein
VIFQKALDGPGSEQTLRVSETPIQPWFTFPDGRGLIYEENSRGGDVSAQLLMIDGSRAFSNRTPPGFRRDLGATMAGRPLAGIHPQWSADGKELDYLTTPDPDAPVRQACRLDGGVDRNVARFSRRNATPFVLKDHFSKAATTSPSPATARGSSSSGTASQGSNRPN